jgi:hypothetical protein
MFKAPQASAAGRGVLDLSSRAFLESRSLSRLRSPLYGRLVRVLLFVQELVEELRVSFGVVPRRCTLARMLHTSFPQLMLYTSRTCLSVPFHFVSNLVPLDNV